MENIPENDGPYDAAQALNDVAASRRATAERLVTPVWYHPVLAANVALLVWLVGHSRTLHFAAFMACALLSLGISLALIQAYKRITGLWVGPAEVGPRSRRIWAGYGVLVAAALVGAGIAAPVDESGRAVLVLAVVAAVGTIIIGRRMDDVMRQEIRDGSMPLPGLPR